MIYPYSKKISSNYENFIAVCPICEVENTYNRVTDLKTIEPISFKTVKCFKCNQNFNINCDTVSEAYQYLILDVYELKKQKRYMYCILNLAQAMESFLIYSIRVKLLWQPFKDRVIEGADEFNSISNQFHKTFEKDTFGTLKSLFFKIYLKNLDFSSTSKIDDFIKNHSTYKQYKPTDREIEDYPNSNLVNLFLKLNTTKVPDLRNKVVHKYSYRPTLEEVEECLKETRDIVFRLTSQLEIKDNIYYFVNRNT
jgi:hypothetical protein